LNIKIPKNNNITWYDGYITSQDREKLHNHKGAVIWFTGLSASGKSTVARHVENRLFNMGCSTYVFDGDNVRHGLCADLGFSPEDRTENIRRIGEMVKLFVDAGIIAITAFISPYREDRQRVRSLITEGNFLEVFVDSPVDVCAKRDRKGIYAKAKAGIIKEFTGISAPYERPKNPELVIKSYSEDPKQSSERVITMMNQRKII